MYMYLRNSHWRVSIYHLDSRKKKDSDRRKASSIINFKTNQIKILLILFSYKDEKKSTAHFN